MIKLLVRHSAILLTTAVLGAMSANALAAEDPFPGIETLMTRDELRAAGIDSLSPRQVDALNTWIERYASGAPIETSTAVRTTTAITAPAPVANQNAVTSPPEDNFRKAPEKIDFVARIAGQFNGWSGRTRFTLENGQVWEQRRGNRWKITLDQPEVRIRENFMGAFEMEVISEGRSIGVRRIQ